MRQSFNNQYDAVFNLFTSFGYFEDDAEDILVLQNMKDGLNANGVLVLDFLNVEMVKKNLIPYELKTIDGIDFHIRKEIKDGFIIKYIEFQDKGKDYSFTEEVKYIDLPKFQDYFEKAGFNIQHLFGNYELSEFDSKTSDRSTLRSRGPLLRHTRDGRWPDHG